MVLNASSTVKWQDHLHNITELLFWLHLYFKIRNGRGNGNVKISMVIWRKGSASGLRDKVPQTPTGASHLDSTGLLDSKNVLTICTALSCCWLFISIRYTCYTSRVRQIYRSFLRKYCWVFTCITIEIFHKKIRKYCPGWIRLRTCKVTGLSWYY